MAKILSYENYFVILPRQIDNGRKWKNGRRLVVASNIKRLREASGFTQESVANYLGIKRSAYSNYETGEREALDAVLDANRTVKSVAVITGPEGGFEETEIRQAEEAGFEAVTLGKRILRTETAGFVVLSLLMAQTEGK